MGKNEHIEKSDVLIRIRPEIDGSEWTGQVELFAILSSDTLLNDKSVYDLEYFVELVLASIPAMNKDPYIYNELKSYAEKKMGKERDNSNVIKLNFNSETEGSA